MQEAEVGFVALVCGDSSKAYLVSREEFLKWLPDLLTTPAALATQDEVRHWHVYFNDYGFRVDLMRSGGSALKDIKKFSLSET